MGAPLQKLSREQIADIVRLHAEGMSYRKLADQYGVSHVNVKEHCDRALSMPVKVSKPTSKPNGPPKHNVKTPEKDMSPAEWKLFLARMDEHGDHWNCVQMTVWMVQAIDRGVKDQVIMDKTGLGTLKWFKAALAKGETALWAWVLGNNHDIVPTGVDVELVEESEGCTALARIEGTSLSTRTPAGQLALARLSDLLPAPNIKPMSKPTDRQLSLAEREADPDAAFASDGTCEVEVAPLPPRPVEESWDEMKARIDAAPKVERDEAAAFRAKFPSPQELAEKGGGVAPPPAEYLEAEEKRMAALRVSWKPK